MDTKMDKNDVDEPFIIGDIIFENPIDAEEKFQAAVRDGDVGYVEDVLQHDKDCNLVNTKDRRGRTPLVIAITRGNMRKFGVLHKELVTNDLLTLF